MGIVPQVPRIPRRSVRQRYCVQISITVYYIAFLGHSDVEKARSDFNRQCLTSDLAPIPRSHSSEQEQIGRRVGNQPAAPHLGCRLLRPSKGAWAVREWLFAKTTFLLTHSHP